MSVTAAEVRKFALEKGIEVKEGRGRLPKTAILAFNAENPRRKFTGNQPKRLTFSAKPAKGRTKTRKATAAEVRTFALEHGLKVGGRGRLSAEATRAFVLGVENV